MQFRPYHLSRLDAAQGPTSLQFPNLHLSVMVTLFSSSGRTDTAARNRLSPVLMEALQILKFNRRNNVLDFSSAIRDDPKDLKAVIPEERMENEVAKAVGMDFS